MQNVDPYCVTDTEYTGSGRNVETQTLTWLTTSNMILTS